MDSEDTVDTDVDLDMMLDMISSVEHGEEIKVEDRKGQVRIGSALMVLDDTGEVVYEIQARPKAGTTA